MVVFICSPIDAGSEKMNYHPTTTARPKKADQTLPMTEVNQIVGHAKCLGLPEGSVEELRGFLADGVPPGGFLGALLSDAPFSTVAGLADGRNRPLLGSWQALLWYVPSPVRGTSCAVEAWTRLFGGGGK